MKCTSKTIRVMAACLAVCMLTGCGSSNLVKDYKTNDNGSMWKAQNAGATARGMAEDLCVTNENIIPKDLASVEAGAAGLFDLTAEEVIYASNIHERMYPASITKIMTALVFLENYYGDFTDVVNITNCVTIHESGAQLCGYKKGDKVTVDQLLNGLLMYSGNDAANMLAEYTAGSVDEFVNLMNQRAVELGATNTHFVNPHGLNDEEHYTTVYDLYLIFNQVMKYDKFREVINATSYEGTYTAASGETKKVSWKSTNRFKSGDATAPEGVVVIGGKTGTTNAAGNCLILLSQNNQGQDYIAVALREPYRDTLYEDMIKLLGKINK